MKKTHGIYNAGPSAVQQDAQASGEGQAAGRPLRGDAAERDLGDGLRPRPVGHQLKDPDSGCRGYFQPLLAEIIDPWFTYRSENVVEVLDRACGRLGYPKAIRVDQGIEFVSRNPDLWAYVSRRHSGR